MAKISEHYDKHLAAYYSWLFGDFDENVAANYGFFVAQGINPAGSGIAIDLGAGSGFQSVALAQLGFRVVSIDLSRKLLDELKYNVERYNTGRDEHEKLTIEAMHGDILNFEKHSPGGIELCVCMGDTLTHLDSFRKVASMCKKVYDALERDGRFIVSFRDLTVELEELDRFIPVRSDENTVFSCFLEYEKKHVKVHDLIYYRNDARDDCGDNTGNAEQDSVKGDMSDRGRWNLSKSYYRKLRIPMEWMVAGLKSTGFTVDSCENKRGMITIIAGKPGKPGK